MDLSAVFTLVAFVIGIVLLLPLLVGAVFVVVVVANRADPDLSGRRPAVVYAFATAFITLFVTLFATTAFVASLCRLIGSDDGGMPLVYSDSAGLGGAHQHPLGDSVARGAVLSALAALIAGVVFVLHVRAAARATDDLPTTDPLARMRSSYVAAASFVSVVITIIASVVVLYDVFRLIAPGVFSGSGDGSRTDVLRSMLPALYLAVAAIVILAAHLKHAPPPFRPGVFSRWYGGPAAPAAEAAPLPVTTPPLAPAPDAEVEVMTSPAPRKRAPRKTTGGS